MRREVLLRAWQAVFETWTEARTMEANDLERIIGRKPGELAEYLIEELRGSQA